MAIRVSDIVKQTLTYINEYSADMEEQDVSESLGAQAKEDMLAQVDAAARLVAQVAPANMQVATTDNAYTLTLNARPDGRLHGTAALPGDYMRLVYLVCNKLYRPITVLLPSTHPTYPMQFCPIAGLGNGDYSPIAYIVDGTIDVHSFGVQSDDSQQEGQETETVTIVYLVLPVITQASQGEFENIEAGTDVYKTLKEELRDVIAMQAAALYLSMTDNAAAVTAQQMATGMLNGIVNKDISKE